MNERETVVVCFGDSNTHGTAPMEHVLDSRRFVSAVRWPGVMAGILGAGFRVVEEGLPGRTTVHPDPIEGAHLDGRAALPMVIGTHTPIDVFVIMLGTNDLKARFSVTARDIGTSLERLVRETRAWTTGTGRPLPKLLVVAPPPILEVGCLREMFAGGAAKSVELAAVVRESAERAGVGFLDAADHIRSSPVDGIHFDEEEHAALGRAIAEAVRRLVAV